VYLFYGIPIPAIMRRILLLIVSFFSLGLFLGVSSVQAQKENNIWYFGHNAGIDFNGPTPLAIVGAQGNVEEGMASIAHWRTGALLFYSDGFTVWNRDHVPMPNGTNLVDGDNTSTQAALIVPFPQDTNKYFLICSDNSWDVNKPNTGIFYSVIDMRLDGGRGDVLLKNIPLFAPPMTEKLTAVPHADGCGIWIIAHRAENSQYEAVLLRDSTFASAHVTSSVGDNPRPGDSSFNSIGYLVPSPDGTKLAYVSARGRAEVLDFDATTGKVSNNRILANNFDFLYGACFSPNSTKLYISTHIPKPKVTQYDVTLPTEDDIVASAQVIGTANNQLDAIRPGPDGKLYVAVYFTQNIAVINNPNASGAACDFVLNGVQLAAGTRSGQGLPNVIDAYMGRSMRPCLNNLSILSSKDEICAGGCIELHGRGLGANAFTWFVDNGTISNANDSLTTVCFAEPGVHKVTLAKIVGVGDTEKVNYSIIVQPSTDTVIISAEDISTDTIGGPVRVPIVMNKKIALSSYSLSVRYDRNGLEYLGTVNANGTSLDQGAIEQTGTAAIFTNTISNDSILGYAMFNVYWNSAGCSEIHLDSIQLEPAQDDCFAITTPSVTKICLTDTCGTSVISEFMRGKTFTLRISPNPAHSVISLTPSVSLKNARIELLDLQGRLIMEKRADLDSDHPTALPITDLSEGKYYLRVTSAGVNTTQQLTIIK